VRLKYGSATVDTRLREGTGAVGALGARQQGAGMHSKMHQGRLIYITASLLFRGVLAVVICPQCPIFFQSLEIMPLPERI